MSGGRLRLLAGHRDRWSPWLIPVSMRNLWLSAQDHGVAALMTDDGSGLISSWSGRGNLGQTFTAATSARPTYSATGMASLYPAVSGDGVANAMTMASTTGLPVLATPSVMISLASGNPASGHLFAYGTQAGSAQRRLQTTSGGGLQASNSTTAISAGTGGTNPRIIVGSWATDLTEAIRVDGGTFAASTTMSAFSTTATRSRIFSSANTSASNFWLGALSEHLILSGSIATLLSTIQMIEGWLAWTAYPLLNLATAFPASHPYKGGPP